MVNCKLCFEKIHFNGINALIKNRMICQKCYNGFELINKKEYINGIEVRYLYDYNDFLKKNIYLLKGCYDIELKDIFLDRWKYILRLIYKGYLLVPVPSYFESDNKRGFNHVEEIFASLKLKSNKCLKKTKDIKQANLSKKQREKIDKVLIIENGEILKGKKVLIVDDIYTTGSTLNACIKLVRKYYPKVLKCLVLCKKTSKK